MLSSTRTAAPRQNDKGDADEGDPSARSAGRWCAWRMTGNAVTFVPGRSQGTFANTGPGERALLLGPLRCDAEQRRAICIG